MNKVTRELIDAIVSVQHTVPPASPNFIGHLFCIRGKEYRIIPKEEGVDVMVRQYDMWEDVFHWKNDSWLSLPFTPPQINLKEIP